ncbi:peptidase C65 Otubain-domain-containing protein [Panaeolus papilionaceus]|nr:peptidase C65 Otubain-domain-containing protein [Panaeolus papilionaceus]
MSSLRAEYENGNPNFVGQIDELMSKGFKYVRRTRGDGDCFYRSLAFALIHSLIHSSDKDLAVARVLSTLAQTPELLDSAGIEKMVYEDFYEEVVGLVERVVNDKKNGGIQMRDEGLLEAFQDPETSNAVVIYLRFVTSAHIRMNPDQFEGFVEHPDTREPMDVESYCANFVQAMGKEADNVEIQALVAVLQLNVDVAYLNGGSPRNVDFIQFRNDVDLGGEPLVLLYRPGHYDVLSKSG